MHVRLMRREDISQVTTIDREVFPTDWPPTNFSKEIENRLAIYVVVTENPPPASPLPPAPRSSFFDRFISVFSNREKPPVVQENPVIGYAGMWMLADEAHVMSLASTLQHRRQGIGEALLFAIFDIAGYHHARVVTLEVRESNLTAQNLYIKFGFRNVGTRVGYYLDNKEDAIIMTTDYIGSADVQTRLQALKNEMVARRGKITFDLFRT